MSQREILNHMNKKWITSCELKEQLPFISKQSINESLRRLCKAGFLVCEKDENYRHGYKYKEA